MSKNIHKQIIDGEGTISLEGEELSFTFPDCLTGAKDFLQDEDKLVEYFKNFKTEKYPNGILLNMFHQSFGQARVNWSADVKRQAIIKEKDENGKVIGKKNIFSSLSKDCSKSWIPPVQGLAKSKKDTLIDIITKLVGLGYDANILLTNADKLAEACQKEEIKL